jgi:NodT family efflux transporter outer membrane factor (OMF) lipoprotein
MLHRFVRGAAVSSLALLVGCKGALPPATPVPPAPTATGYADVPPAATVSANVAGGGGASQHFVRDLDVPAQWWTLFHSPELSELVAEGIAKNPDVDAAQAALRALREQYYAQRASAYPNAQGSFSVSREQVPTYLSPPLSTTGSQYAYAVHTLSLDVAYVPDVFGNLRYQTANARDAAEMQRYQTEATYLALTSNIALTAFEVASLRGQLESTKRIIDVDRRLLAITKLQREYAQAAGLDVLTQEAALRAVEQTVPPLRKQLAQAIDALARLVGRTPNDPPVAAFDLAALHLPEELPLSLPSKLLEQRPDIAAASANLAGASAEVGVAYTNRLPNFGITAQAATQALTLGGLFGAGSFLSQLTGQVTQTFYDHGTLKHREAAAVAQYDEAAAQYRGAILSGLQNVADAMVALERDADALRAADRSEVTASHALDIVRFQDAHGEVSSPVVLTAEATYEQAELALVQTKAARYSDTVALFAALGGGWWNRSETSPTK